MIATHEAICMGKGTLRPPGRFDLPSMHALARCAEGRFTPDSLARLLTPDDDEELAAPIRRAGALHGACIAELDDGIVGLAALRSDGRDTAALILAVDRTCDAAPVVRIRLLEIALAAARRFGLLKVWLETEPIADAMSAVSSLFRRFGYVLHRSRFVEGRCRSEYVLDLYHRVNNTDPHAAPPPADRSEAAG